MTMLAPMPSGTPTTVVYAGTPDVAVGPLRAIHGAGFHVACVLTGIDKRRGRGNETTPSPVKVAAAELGIPVVHDVAELTAYAGPNALGVVVAYGSMIPHATLSVLPMVNAHYSLLPRWRGAAPVERAILAGDATTGVCIMRVVDELDAGEVFARRELSIGDHETADELRGRLDAVAQDLLVTTLRRGEWVGQPQEGDVVYARKILTIDRRMTCEDSQREARRIRIGGAFVKVGGRRVRVLAGSAADTGGANRTMTLENGKVVLGCLRGSVVCHVVQPEGRSSMSAVDWWRGLQSPDAVVIDDE